MSSDFGRPTYQSSPQARIRFALDNQTWLRLQGLHKTLPAKYQGSLTPEQATEVWLQRLKNSLKALCVKFHLQYGPPEAVILLGGNSLQCYGRLGEITYENPDLLDKAVEADPIGEGFFPEERDPQSEKDSSQKSVKDLRIPVISQPTDKDQQDITMSGLMQSTRFKVRQVYSSGNDPLDRGWTRGGEVYHWIPRKSKGIVERNKDLPKSATAPGRFAEVPGRTELSRKTGSPSPSSTSSIDSTTQLGLDGGTSRTKSSPMVPTVPPQTGTDGAVLLEDGSSSSSTMDNEYQQYYHEDESDGPATVWRARAASKDSEDPLEENRGERSEEGAGGTPVSRGPVDLSSGGTSRLLGGLPTRETNLPEEARRGRTSGGRAEEGEVDGRAERPVVSSPRSSSSSSLASDEREALAWQRR